MNSLRITIQTIHFPVGSMWPIQLKCSNHIDFFFLLPLCCIFLIHYIYIYWKLLDYNFNFQWPNILFKSQYPLGPCILLLKMARFYLLWFILLKIYFCLFRAVPVANRGSQARGWIGAAAAGLYHSQSNTRS